MSLVWDLFELILEASYPQHAINLARSCKRIAQMMHNPKLYYRWFKRFYPDFDIPDHLMSAGIGGPKATELRNLFVKMWSEVRYVEMYKLDAIYDIERVMSIQPIVLGIGHAAQQEVTLVMCSRFPSRTALKTLEWDPTVRITETTDSRRNWKNPFSAMSGLWNPDIAFNAKRNVMKAQRSLAGKIHCFTLTSYASITYAHNVRLLCNLYEESDNFQVASAGDSVRRLRFDRNDWTRALVIVNEGDREIRVIFELPKAIHKCNCEFCPVSRGLIK